MPASADFTEAVYAVVESIPPGRVMTYGDVAAAIGSRAARGVGQVMAWSGDSLPWWRVVRASGEPPQCHEAEARTHYAEEGTPMRGARVDLRQARHLP